MRKYRMERAISLVIVLILTLLVSFTLPVGAGAEGPSVCVFWGTVQLDTANVTDGTQIAAWVEGAGPWFTTTFTPDGEAFSAYVIQVPKDDSFTAEKDGATQGETVYFSIANRTVAQTANWVGGECIQMELATSSLFADFSADKTQVEVGESIRFTNGTTGGKFPYTYAWEFGDSQSSSQQHPSHSYTTAGTYTVRLTVGDIMANTDEETKTNYVTVGTPGAIPPYTWGHTPASGAADIPIDTNIIVHIHDNDEGVNQSTIVMTVEGSAVTPEITGTPSDYTLTYDPPSDFTHSQVVDVTVAASDLAGNTMPTDSYSFTTVGASGPDTSPPYISGHNPEKDATDVAIDTEIVVHVKDNGTGVDRDTIAMTVEGAPATLTITGTKADYTLTYEKPDCFGYLQTVDVTVSASDLAGNQMPMHSYSFTTTSEALASDLTVNFTASKTEAAIGESIDLTAIYTGGLEPYSYKWNFGDDTTSSMQNPSHAYSKAGTYTVSLEVTDSLGDRTIKTKTDFITVGATATNPANTENDSTDWLPIIIGMIVGGLILLGLLLLVARRTAKAA